MKMLVVAAVVVDGVGGVVVLVCSGSISII
jgi:hypothetical protein